MIRQDFELPPKYFLMQIADATMKVYLYLWEKKDSLSKVKISWEDATKLFSKNTFRTSLRKLFSEGLINYKETIDSVSIEVTGWDEVNG